MNQRNATTTNFGIDSDADLRSADRRLPEPPNPPLSDGGEIGMILGGMAFHRKGALG